jgi:hypothetical protein
MPWYGRRLMARHMDYMAGVASDCGSGLRVGRARSTPSKAKSIASTLPPFCRGACRRPWHPVVVAAPIFPPPSYPLAMDWVGLPPQLKALRRPPLLIRNIANVRRRNVFSATDAALSLVAGAIHRWWMHRCCMRARCPSAVALHRG